jgi:transposase InsO family protein
MCVVLKVSRSGYYGWMRRPASERKMENKEILDAIKEIRAKEPKKMVYGSPRMKKEMNERGFSCGKNRVARIMSKNGIKAKTVKKFKQTTDSNHKLPIAPNLLARDFYVDAPDKVYVMDITYIWTAEGWLYLAIVLDLFSRMLVGWAMSARITGDLVIEALNRAILSRNPRAGLIAHSDKGSQYACYEYRELLNKHGFIQSMSGKGNCYDNAVAESFFHTLKTEWVFFERYQTRAQARTSIFDYIETFYNRERRHSYLGDVSPLNYERTFAMAA